MLISELKEKLESGKPLEELLEVKSYLSVSLKKVIADNIVERSVEIDQNAIMQVNYFNKKMLRDMLLIVEYSNLEFSDEGSIEEYDYLCENKILDKIIGLIPESEIDFIDDLVHYELKQKVELNNSLTNIVAKSLNDLINKIPDQKSITKTLNSLPKILNKVKPENLEILKGFINQQKVN